MSRWAVMLAGGVGSRFWPLSTPERPKQLLPLVDDEPLLADTLARLEPLVPAERTLDAHQRIARRRDRRAPAELPRGEHHRRAASRRARPPRSRGRRARSRGAAARDDVMICVHADWAIGDDDGFPATLARAADAAERERCAGDGGRRADASRSRASATSSPANATAADGARARRAVRREARSRSAPSGWCASGYLWNSGHLRLARRRFSRRGARAHARGSPPLLAEHADDIAAFFARVTPISVDVGVLERSARVLVVSGRFRLGRRRHVGRAAPRAQARRRAGNATFGDVSRSMQRGQRRARRGSAVVLYGVTDLVVVTRDGLTLVTTKDGAADLKTLIDALPSHRARAHVTRLYLYDDATARELRAVRADPPVRELRAGAELDPRAMGARARTRGGRLHRRGSISRDFEEVGRAAGGGRRALPAGSIIANSALPRRRSARVRRTRDVWTCDGRVAAVRLPKSMRASRARDGSRALESLARGGHARRDDSGRWLGARVGSRRAARRRSCARTFRRARRRRSRAAPRARS